MSSQALIAAASFVPQGPWAVGVSGGADSVALLFLLRELPNRPLHIVHLNHQSRASASDEDAAFVQSLASEARIPCTLARLSEIEEPGPSKNPSTRYRRARLALFRQVVAKHGLQGVVLAHHADDQAETVLLRLLRGSPPEALGGIQPHSKLQNLLVLHPLLSIRSESLRDFLISRQIPWREDASNASPAFDRNRARALLRALPALTDALLLLADRSASWEQWLRSAAPQLPSRFPIAMLPQAPRSVASYAVRRWLQNQGMPPSAISRKMCDRILLMADDAAVPHRWSLGHGYNVRRKDAHLFLERTAP
jgi:tRNA(Ile)-lysidine synthase